VAFILPFFVSHVSGPGHRVHKSGTSLHLPDKKLTNRRKFHKKIEAAKTQPPYILFFKFC